MRLSLFDALEIELVCASLTLKIPYIKFTEAGPHGEAKVVTHYAPVKEPSLPVAEWGPPTQPTLYSRFFT